MSMVNSPSGSGKPRLPEKGWRLPLELRDDKMPFGKLVNEEDLAELLAECTKLITVGDVVSLALTLIGIVPDIAIYDGRTQRARMSEFADIVTPDVTVNNPAGVVTRELYDAIKDAMHHIAPICILVNGEEDLAFIPAALLAPEGACLIYGLPNQGMVLAIMDESTTRKINDIITRLEVMI